MAATCELEDGFGKICEVAAIGRCHACGRAFCGSHRSFLHGGPSSDRCDPCPVRTEHEERQHAFAQDTAYMANTALAELRAAAVPTVRIYARRTETQKQPFGRSRSVEHTDLWAAGWLVGSHEWHFNVIGPHGGTDIHGPAPTVLIDKTFGTGETYKFQFDVAGIKFARVSNDRERGIYLVERSQLFTGPGGIGVFATHVRALINKAAAT